MTNMKRITGIATASLIATSAIKGQLLDEGNVTIYLDLQPVLQLNVQGPSEITFTFDQIYKYYGGVIKYGATILKVSSSVTWDLWAAGTSSGNHPICGRNCWDIMMLYGNNGTDAIPLTALELHQYPDNPSFRAGGVPATAGGFGLTCANGIPGSSDYSTPFAQYNYQTQSFLTTASGQIYVPDPAGANGPYTPPTSAGAAPTEKYIAGASGTAQGTNQDCGIPGGTYLAQFGVTPALPSPNSLFYYVIDYRILPGLPARFPAHNPNTPGVDGNLAGAGGYLDRVATAAGYTPQTFARPGAYTMNVKYILTEDQ